MNTEHIKLFVEQTGLRFEDKGEIGFGRNCVGIVDDKTNSYIAYHSYDSEYKVKLYHEVAGNTRPEDAYHKGPYLAVLYDGTEEGKVKAINQLNEWIEKILAAGFEIEEFEETNSFSALMAGGSVTQKCLAGGVSFGKFLEIF